MKNTEVANYYWQHHRYENIKYD